MKRNLMLFLVSALLVCSLTACGCASKDAGNTQSNNGTTSTMQPESNSSGANSPGNDSAQSTDRPGSSDSNTGNGTNGANTGDGTTIGPGESMPEDAGSAIENGVNDAADAITGNDAANSDGGVSIDDMLRNGRVRDN